MSYTSSNLRVFCGSANPRLTDEICKCLDLKKGELVVDNFSDGETSIRIDESVRGADVFIIQPTCAPANDNIMKLLIIIDGMRRASASRITAVIPYYGYSRQEKKTAGREPITAKLVANLITKAGADRVVAIDLHTGALQGFFDIPVDHVSALPLLANYFKQKLSGQDTVVVSPDAGGVGRARAFAKLLGAPLAIVDKRRPAPNEAVIMNLIGEVSGRIAIMVDDMIDTAGTITNGSKMLNTKGAKEIYACATHAVLSGEANLRLAESPIKEVVVTDTIPVRPDNADKITVLSTAPLISEVIYRIHKNLSVSKLFE